MHRHKAGVMEARRGGLGEEKRVQSAEQQARDRRPLTWLLRAEFENRRGLLVSSTRATASGRETDRIRGERRVEASVVVKEVVVVSSSAGVTKARSCSAKHAQAPGPRTARCGQLQPVPLRRRRRSKTCTLILSAVRTTSTQAATVSAFPTTASDTCTEPVMADERCASLMYLSPPARLRG